MKLKAWLELREVTLDEFAMLLAVDRATVWRWSNGRFPRHDYLAAIAKATKGAVTANDFM
jgi:transcriptional regulator with XRE-family HTH domain